MVNNAKELSLLCSVNVLCMCAVVQECVVHTCVQYGECV